MRAALLVLVSLLAVTGCRKTTSMPAPPKVTSAAQFPTETSTIVVPLSAPLDEVEAALERELPRQLWSINQHVETCVPPQRVNLGIARVRVVPRLSCQVVGQVTRGRVRLSGSGDRLLIAMPINAQISANNVGGIASRTATGSAVVHAVARLTVSGNWQPSARVSIEYNWTTPPGIDFLGTRIEFADKADEKLRPIVAKLEQTLPQKLQTLRLRERLDGVWRQGFTVLSLNRDNPPAWMRVTPRRLGFGGYRVEGRTLQLTLAAEALTETFLGPKPADPAATPLPPPSPIPPARGLRFFIPVLADYRELEPVVLRTLTKRAAKGINISGVGPVNAQFGRVTIYATLNGQIAVGVDARATAPEHPSLNTSGRIWLVATPFNRPGSQAVEARNVRLAADTDSNVANLLIRYFNDGQIQQAVAQGLHHDFAPDYNRVLGKARAAIASRQEGDFLLSAQVSRVETGVLAVTGQGLFLPVRASGVASIGFRPR